MDGLNTVLEYLTSVPAWYLATSVDGQPHVRPFAFAQIILRGRAGLDDRALDEMREAGWKHLERLGEHYEGPNDPTLVFFSVEDPEAFICNHDEWVPVEL